MRSVSRAPGRFAAGRHALAHEAPANRAAHRVLLRAPHPNHRRARRPSKSALVLLLLSPKEVISRLPLVPRALGVPTSRGKFVRRALTAPRAALFVLIRHGALIPRALRVPSSRDTFISRAIATPRAARAAAAPRGRFVRRARAASRGAPGSAASRGRLVARAHGASRAAAFMPRASLGSRISRGRFVPGAPARSTSRGTCVPRDAVRGESPPSTRSVVRAEPPAPDRAPSAPLDETNPCNDLQPRDKCRSASMRECPACSWPCASPTSRSSSFCRCTGCTALTSSSRA